MTAQNREREARKAWEVARAEKVRTEDIAWITEDWSASQAWEVARKARKAEEKAWAEWEVAREAKSIH